MAGKHCKNKRSRRNRSRNQRKSKSQRRSQRRNQSQRGGMAPFDAPYQSMSEAAARSMAGVASLDNSIAELPRVIPRQSGGNSDLAPFRGGGWSGKRSRRSQRSQRSQRGGNAPFDAPYTLGYALPGVNPQFANESMVNSLYSATRGAQGY